METSAEPVIALRGVGKRYSMESRPWHRLWAQLRGRPAQLAGYDALQPLDLELHRGEVLGLVGRNGAGKSTLLQLVCGVLEPSCGTRVVKGRIAALLELGAGFNPELTGRENVRLNGPLLGIPQAEIEARMEEIIAFAGIGDFLDQPVRSYSSGMFMRLAFAMATSLDPDILIIDEALSVGDGAFARKSFQRIMDLKDRGATILFCSHSPYHIESICTRALWLERGQVRMQGDVGRVVAAYNATIDAELAGVQAEAAAAALPAAVPAAEEPVPAYRPGQGRILALRCSGGGQAGRELRLRSRLDDLRIEMDFLIDPSLPPPTMLMALYTRAGLMVTSAGTHNDSVLLERDSRGFGRAALTLPELPLLKGEYYVNVILACERGLHFYESADQAVVLHLEQSGLEQGLVSVRHRWS